VSAKLLADKATRAVIVRLPEPIAKEGDDVTNARDTEMVRGWLKDFGMGDEDYHGTHRHGRGPRRVVKIQFSSQTVRDLFLINFAKKRPANLKGFENFVYCRRDLCDFELKYDRELRHWCYDTNKRFPLQSRYFVVRD